MIFCSLKEAREKYYRTIFFCGMLKLLNFAQENYSAFPQRLISISRFALTIINNITFALH